MGESPRARWRSPGRRSSRSTRPTCLCVRTARSTSPAAPAIRDGLAASPLDHNGDGRIDPSELQLWLSSLDQQTIDRQLLSRFDTNGDGVVDDAEILSLLPDSLAASSLRLDDLPPGVASSLLLATSAVGLGDEISASRLLAAAHALNITASASDAYAAIANALLAATRSPPPSPPHAAAPPYPLPPPPDASARLRGVAVRLYVASTPNAAEIPAFTDERGVSHHLPLRLSPMACQPFGTNYLSRGWCTADGQVHFELWSPLALAAASPPLSTARPPTSNPPGRTAHASAPIGRRAAVAATPPSASARYDQASSSSGRAKPFSLRSAARSGAAPEETRAAARAAARGEARGMARAAARPRRDASSAARAAALVARAKGA